MEPITEETHYHLCVTHSPLVTRVFEATRRQRGISASAVRSIAKRAVPFPGTGCCLDDVAHAMESCLKRFDRSGYAAARKQLDEALGELTGDKPFEAYVPHANNVLFQEIISHPRCIGYSFLEEGFTSMLWDTWRSFRMLSRKTLRNYLRTYWVRPNYSFNRPMFDHAAATYRAAYAISKHAFHDMPGRADVSGHIPSLPQSDGPANTYVILDTSYLHRGVRWQAYENALVAAILAAAPTSGELRIKFHFVDPKASQRFESIRARLSTGGVRSVSMLGSDFQVEENLTRDDLVLFAVTSLGYYAALAGARVKCFAGDIDGVSISSWIANGCLPADFPEVVGIPRD